MKISFILVLILSSTISTISQTKLFKWTEGLCYFEGIYDSANFTESQIKDTQKLISSLGSIPLLTDATVSTIEDIKTIDTRKLDKEYKATLEKLKNLDIVKSDYWEQIRMDKINELEQYYALSRITIGAYKNPAILKQYKRAESCVDFYAGPLISGGDYLYVTWLKVNMDSRAKNASPDRLKRRFETQNSSADRLKFGRVEVMSFGWWNCAVKTVKMVESCDELYEQFNRLFTKVKEDCDDEP